MANQNTLAPGIGIAADLQVHLGDQRTGGIKHFESAVGGFLSNGRRDAVSAKDDRRTIGNLVQVLHKHRAARPQTVYHVAVMDDFVPHVHRRT